MPNKAEIKCYIALLENEKKKAGKMAMIAELDSVRIGWQHIGRALDHAIALMRREVGE